MGNVKRLFVVSRHKELWNPILEFTKSRFPEVKIVFVSGNVENFKPFAVGEIDTHYAGITFTEKCGEYQNGKWVETGAIKYHDLSWYCDGLVWNVPVGLQPEIFPLFLEVGVPIYALLTDRRSTGPNTFTWDFCGFCRLLKYEFEWDEPIGRMPTSQTRESGKNR